MCCRVAIFFLCASLFELNAWEDERLIVIKFLQEGKKKENKAFKKGRRK
jgi:hypothetical protein